MQMSSCWRLLTAASLTWCRPHVLADCLCLLLSVLKSMLSHTCRLDYLLGEVSGVMFFDSTTGLVQPLQAGLSLHHHRP